MHSYDNTHSPSRRNPEEREVRQLPDADVQHWLAVYQRELAEAHTAQSLMDVNFCLYKVGLFKAEDQRRRRLATTAGTPYDTRFSESFLSELRRRVHLDAVIEFHFGIPLSKRSASGTRRGCCPIHGGDNDTAFAVYLSDPDNERYCCHSCGASGDVFSAIMQSHDVGFREAVMILAAYAGVPLPAVPKPPAPATRQEPGARIMVAPARRRQ